MDDKTNTHFCFSSFQFYLYVYFESPTLTEGFRSKLATETALTTQKRAGSLGFRKVTKKRF